MTEELLKMDRFEEAKLGEGVRFNWEYNQAGAWVGAGTPAFLFKKEEQNERA